MCAPETDVVSVAVPMLDIVADIVPQKPPDNTVDVPPPSGHSDIMNAVLLAYMHGSLVSSINDWT